MNYLALLRGINVGGNNKISMPELKATFESAGLENVITYINSGNVIFNSSLDETQIKDLCEGTIAKTFNLKIAVVIVSSAELLDAVAHAPDWWNKDSNSKHNALFVIPPMTAEQVCTEIGETKPEYEKAAPYGKVIFWSAPLATFSRTRWSKIVENKKAYNAVTIRNANTTLKLVELIKD